jgi:threonine/homoserine/homoserine lactone efflux protein
MNTVLTILFTVLFLVSLIKLFIPPENTAVEGRIFAFLVKLALTIFYAYMAYALFSGSLIIIQNG